MTDWQMLFNVSAGLVAAAFGWFAKTLWDAIQKLKDDLSNLREEIANDRVHKNDFHAALKELKELLIRIEAKVDGKADKGSK